MNSASWGVSAAGVIVAALCIIGLRHHRHLPAATHPISQRAAIFLCYVAGCAVALTAAGALVNRVLAWALGVTGGTGSVAGHTAITVAGIALVASVAVALIFVPDPAAAWLALATPFILNAAGGHLHALLNVVPAQQVTEAIAKWIGG